MVRQFADVHAFARELVQNGIDAGATSIQTLVDRSADGVASVRVTDDGCGMTLDVIENALLVLFRSTKDEDPTKIGKYGVGFMSVFALEPSEVTVDTWRDGYAHRVRLFPDHSYEIESAAPRDGHGTSVTISKTLSAEDFPAFWQKVAASLHRWCRHAEVPIELVVSDGATDEPPKHARVDTPLEVRAIVSVRQKWHDMEIVAGPIAGSGGLPDAGTGEDSPSAFAGFYNRGLTLYETTEALLPELGQVRVKVQSPRLCHTLSRDDVRRDRAFHMALARAKDLCATSLRDATLRALLAAAEAAAGGEDGARFVALLEAATVEPISLVASDIKIPLAHPIHGDAVMSVPDMRAALEASLGVRNAIVYGTAVRSELTEALAACGVPVAWLCGKGVVDGIERVTSARVMVAAVADECLLVRELAVADRLAGDDALCAGLGAALSGSGVERVALGEMPEGKGRVGAIVPGPFTSSAVHVVPIAAAHLDVAKWPGGSLLVLRADSDPVSSARRATSPVIAAHLLARYLLLLGPGLSSGRSEALAVRALEEIR